MIHRINSILLLMFALTLSACGNQQKFQFYKAFATCSDIREKQDIYGYTDIEANKKYKNKIITIDSSKCHKTKGIFKEDDEEYRNSVYQFYEDDAKILSTINKIQLNHFYSSCMINKLNLKYESSQQCSTNNKWPFDKIEVLNSKFLVIMLDGFYFVFQKIDTQ